MHTFINRVCWQDELKSFGNIWKVPSWEEYGVYSDKIPGQLIHFMCAAHRRM